MEGSKWRRAEGGEEERKNNCLVFSFSRLICRFCEFWSEHNRLQNHFVMHSWICEREHMLSTGRQRNKCHTVLYVCSCVCVHSSLYMFMSGRVYDSESKDKQKRQQRSEEEKKLETGKSGNNKAMNGCVGSVHEMLSISKLICSQWSWFALFLSWISFTFIRSSEHLHTLTHTFTCRHFSMKYWDIWGGKRAHARKCDCETEKDIQKNWTKTQEYLRLHIHSRNNIEIEATTSQNKNPMIPWFSAAMVIIIIESRAHT